MHASLNTCSGPTTLLLAATAECVGLFQPHNKLAEHATFTLQCLKHQLCATTPLLMFVAHCSAQRAEGRPPCAMSFTHSVARSNSTTGVIPHCLQPSCCAATSMRAVAVDTVIPRSTLLQHSYVMAADKDLLQPPCMPQCTAALPLLLSAGMTGLHEQLYRCRC
ncbi:hypothetical protein COO60DRAFT_962528 [Scenedesmus sp. NREL 46B-D3]|nr:hypothetical protein COO60DRAFT_962528 [Scenedesmus sp. NREL 46B-D3]